MSVNTLVVYNSVAKRFIRLPPGETVTGVVSTPATYKTLVDDQTPVLYVGRAAVGAIEGQLVWQLKRVTLAGPSVTVAWANGSTSFTNSWDLRESYTYSS